LAVDITGIMLATVAFMYLFSGPRGRNRYYPLGFGVLIAVLAIAYGALNNEALFYPLGAVVLAKGYWMYRRWRD
jgi:hypothetical protein